MMCFKHNRWTRIGKCEFCIKEEKEMEQLEREIALLEMENKLIKLVLWEK